MCPTLVKKLANNVLLNGSLTLDNVVESVTIYVAVLGVNSRCSRGRSAELVSISFVVGANESFLPSITQASISASAELMINS